MITPKQITNYGNKGFTLLEVMISLTILAMTLTIIFGIQSNNLQLLEDSNFNTTATFLANEKLAEFESGFIEPHAKQGDFAPNFPLYSWRLEINDAEFSETPHLKNMSGIFKKIDLIVSRKASQNSYTLTRYKALQRDE